MVDFALTFDHLSAHQINYQQSEKGSTSWLKSAQKLAVTKPDIAAALGIFYWQQGNNKFAKPYLEKAVSEANTTGLIALTELLLAEQKYQRILNLVTTAVIETSLQPLALAELKLEALLALGDFTRLQEFSVELALLSHIQSLTELHKELKSYHVFSLNQQVAVSKRPISTNDECPLSITLLASNLTDLRRWQMLASEYDNDPLSGFICVQQIRYLPPIDEHCQLLANEAIHCDETQLARYTQHISSNYLALMLPRGGANVHLGLLYMDRVDDINVFRHELTHLLGFADEYTIEQPHHLCQEAVSDASWNIATIEKHALIDGKVSYQALTALPWFSLLANEFTHQQTSYAINQPLTKAGIGVFLADTCPANSSIVAVKPLKQRTLLRNHDTQMPQQYFELLSQDIYRYNMPSFHYNIGVALYRQAKGKEALHWLNQVID